MKIYLRLLFVLALVLGTAAVSAPAKSIPASPRHHCCAIMNHQTEHCPRQPTRGMDGSCCSMSCCFPLILQTGEIFVQPGWADVEWDGLSVNSNRRVERPAVPPPRV